MYEVNAHNHQEYAVGGSKENVCRDSPALSDGVVGVFGANHLDGGDDTRKGKQEGRKEGKDHPKLPELGVPFIFHYENSARKPTALAVG